MRFRELERLIVADGWIRCDVKGSHYQYRHPLKKGKVTMAQEACGQYLFNELKEGNVLPVASSIEDVIAEEEGAIVNMVDIDLKAFERKYGEKSVKKTLTIPGWLNASCEERGINFSKVLQEALIARLQAR